MRVVNVDLSVLDYCREDCGDPTLHLAHDGPCAGSVTVQRSTEQVFVGPVVAYRCNDCGAETVAAAGRRRPCCSYCRAPRSKMVSTGAAPGGAMCRGGVVDASRISTIEGVRRTMMRAPCPSCGRISDVMLSGAVRAHRSVEADAIVDPVLTDVVFHAVGHYVPTSFADVYSAARDTYGARLSERNTQRALALLIQARQVASIGDSTWAPARQRTNAVSGYYLRYDSPKLWRAGGLRDLMSVVAQADDERAVGNATLGQQRSAAAGRAARSRAPVMDGDQACVS